MRRPYEYKSERKIPMLSKLIRILMFPFTPIASVVLMGIADGLLRTVGADTLNFAVCLILTAVTVISTLVNLAHYGKPMKLVTLALCFVTVLFLFTEFRDISSHRNAPADQIYGYGDPGYFGDEGGDSGYGIFDTGCTACGGSKKCHVCRGKGDFACNGMYCLRGDCTACDGGGLYDHGSYVSECLTCKGDGICDICDGTNRYDCNTCDGSGRCTHCR